MMFWFRDRLGRRHDRESAKIIPLQIFNLQGQPPSVRLSVNQWVPGSSPGRGAKFLFKINRLRRFSPRDPLIGPRKSAPIGGFTIHRPEDRVLPGPPPFSFQINRLRPLSARDPRTHGPSVCGGSRWAPHEMEAGSGGEGNSKKRTLRFLHWGSVVDPKPTLGTKKSRAARCPKRTSD